MIISQTVDPNCLAVGPGNREVSVFLLEARLAGAEGGVVLELGDLCEREGVLV